MQSTIRGVVIFGAIAIISIILIQMYLVRQTWDLEERKFNQRVSIALLNVAKSLTEQSGNNNLPQRNLINQISADYFIVNFNDVIDAKWLEFYLIRELDKVGLHGDFEYGIYDCGSDRMVYGNYVNLSTLQGKQKEISKRSSLPKYDKFIYYFGVRFPDKANFLLNSLRLMLAFSAILITTVLFFGVAVFALLRQKKLSEMQKDFINNMTHEFKTPISTIKISADVFLNNPTIQSDSRLSKYAAIIKEQNDRLNNQVEKVLQLARIEGDSFKLNIEDVNLHELLHGILQSANLKAAELKGDIIAELKAIEPIIAADRLHLTNVIHNLLDNAIKYHNNIPHIQVSTADVLGRVHLIIRDNGIGIPKEHQQKIFDKFYRIPTGNVHNVKGFGLGLFYVKNICDAHHWKLSLQSEPNIGTTIMIEMQRAV
ncbi:MAG: HAMP domain-containing histidine kinase [Saprospiraceae bacterium]|nr:HAMP domain-containing histidine kinase [Saprospiraceae bacterium]